MAGTSKRTEGAAEPATTEVGRTTWEAVRDCARFLDGEKALDVVVVDIGAKSSFADYFIIATSQSTGHLKGLARNVDEVLARHGVYAKGGKRGVNEDDTWVLLDCGDFIIHLMKPEAREFYAIEKLWFDCPVADWKA